MAKTSLHAFKEKDTRFVADWLKSKGLHKLCSVFEGIIFGILTYRDALRIVCCQAWSLTGTAIVRSVHGF